MVNSIKVRDAMVRRVKEFHAKYPSYDKAPAVNAEMPISVALKPPFDHIAYMTALHEVALKGIPVGRSPDRAPLILYAEKAPEPKMLGTDEQGRPVYEEPPPPKAEPPWPTADQARAYLAGKGYTETEPGKWALPNGEHYPTGKQEQCLKVLKAEIVTPPKAHGLKAEAGRYGR